MAIKPPRRRTVGVQTEDDGKEHLAAPHQGIDTEDLSPDVEKVLDELGASASAVIVERMKDNKPGEWEYVTRLSADEYKTEYIKEQFGGGEYKITIIDAIQGRLNPVLLSIDRRFVGKLYATMATPVASGGIANDPFRDRLLEVLLAKALTPAAPASSNRETIELVLAVVGALRGGGGGGDVAEQVNNMIQTSLTLAQAMNPPEGIAGVAANYLPVIEKLVTASSRSNRPPTLSVTRPALPPASPTAPPVVVTPPPTQPMRTNPAPAHVAGSIIPKWLEPFRLYAGQLVKVADRGSDPTMYADLAIEEIQEDDDVFAAAVQAMNDDRLAADLFAVCPELEKTEKRKEFAAEFVSRFREALQELLSQPDEEADDTETGTVQHG